MGCFDKVLKLREPRNSASLTRYLLLKRDSKLRNIISIVKPTRRTNVSNLFYFGMTLYLFRTVFPSITRSSILYILQQAFVKQILLSAYSK